MKAKLAEVARGYHIQFRVLLMCIVRHFAYEPEPYSDHEPAIVEPGLSRIH